MWNSAQPIHHRLRCVPKRSHTHFTLFVYRFFFFCSFNTITHQACARIQLVSCGWDYATFVWYFGAILTSHFFCRFILVSRYAWNLTKIIRAHTQITVKRRNHNRARQQLNVADSIDLWVLSTHSISLSPLECAGFLLPFYYETYSLSFVCASRRPDWRRQRPRPKR